jgi:hypothetical protein
MAALMKTFAEVEKGKALIPEPVIQRVEIDYGDAGSFERAWIYFTTPNRFRVMENWKITLSDGTQAMVPKLFVFTGASIPWFLRPFATAFGPLLRASLFHDYGYAKNFILDWAGNKIFEGKGQKFFDDWFREIAAITSHLKGLAVSAWAGVRALGVIAWNRHRGKGNGEK